MDGAEAVKTKGQADALLSAKHARLLWIIVIAMAAMNMYVAARLLPEALSGYGDFSAFYTAGKLLHQDPAALYDFRKQAELRHAMFPEVTLQSPNLPFYHPAYEALIYAALATLPYRTAYAVWFAINAGALLLALWSLRVTFIDLHWAQLLLLALAFFPIVVGLMHGQDSVLLLALYVAAFHLLVRGRPFTAGLVLALGLFKFHLVIPLVVVFAVQRRWRFVGGFATGGAALAALSVVTTGTRGARDYINMLLHFGTLTRATTGNVDSQMPSLGGFIASIWRVASGAPLSGVVIVVASAALFVVAAYAAKDARENDADDSLRLTFAFGLVTALLVGHHTNVQDLALLFPALLIAGSTANRLRQPRALAVVAILWFSPLYMLLLTRGVLTFMFLPIAALLYVLSRHLRASDRREEPAFSAR